MRRRPSTALLVILAVALVARVAVVVATPHYVPIFDAADYDRQAASIADGHGYAGPQRGPADAPTALRPPLYPVTLAVVHALGGGRTAGRLLGVVIGTVPVLLVYLICLRVWGRRVALGAAAITAVFPPLVIFSATLLSEPLFVSLVLGAVLAVLAYRDDARLRWALLAGVLCGLATLTRSNGAFLVVAAAVGVWTLKPRFSRRGLAAPVAVALAALVTVTPWVVRNWIAFDRYVGLNTQTGVLMAGTYNPEARARAERTGHPGRPRVPWATSVFRDIYARKDLDEAEVSARLKSRALDYIGDHPGYVAETTFWNAMRVLDLVHDGGWRPVLGVSGLQARGVNRLVSPVVPATAYLLFLLALVGVAAQVGLLPSRRAPPFIWLFPVLAIVPSLAVWAFPRYRAPVDPFLIMLAAVGVVALMDRVRAAEPRARAVQKA